MKKKKGKYIKCKICKKEFYVYPYAFSVRQYCSNKCKGIDYENNHPMKGKYKKSRFIKCRFCQKEFRAYDKFDSKYCSRDCYTKGGKTKLNKERLIQTRLKTKTVMEDLINIVKKNNNRIIIPDAKPRPDLIVVDFDKREVIAYELESNNRRFMERKIYSYRQQFKDNGLVYDKVIVKDINFKKEVWQKFPAKNLECIKP